METLDELSAKTKGTNSVKTQRTNSVKTFVIISLIALVVWIVVLLLGSNLVDDITPLID